MKYIKTRALIIKASLGTRAAANYLAAKCVHIDIALEILT